MISHRNFYLYSLASLLLGVLLTACSAGSNKPSPKPVATAQPAKVQVIMSGVDNYWQPGTAVSGESKDTVRIDPTKKYQTWHGLGGTFNEAGWQALLQLSEQERQKILRLLFDKNNGAGFEWGRIPIGASDFALQRYTLNDNPGDISMSQFSIARDRKFLIPYIQAAQAVNADIKFWGSPWTPPPWMKTNKAYDRGAFDPKYSEAYARYFVEWISAYENEGIPIDHVQPQNEPGWSQTYPSCAWGPSVADGKFIDGEVTLGKFVEDHLVPTLAREHPDTDVWYGTLSNNQTYDAYWEALSSEGRAAITGVGLQWSTRSRVAELSTTTGKNGKNLLVMQTEHVCGNYPWLEARATSASDANRGNFLASHAPNNHAYGEESWELISSWIKAGVHIYSAWNMVLDTGGFNLDVDRPWPQNALIAVDESNKTYSITPAYYVFRHIGQFVAPSAQRVEISTSDELDALAFENTDKTLVGVLYNRQESAQKITLSAKNERLQIEVPARGWATVIID